MTLPATCQQLSPYLIENGLRKVKPYIHTFETYAKNYMFKKKIISFAADYGQTDLPRDCQLGRLRVNKKKVTENYKIKQYDTIAHTVHVHEPPVVSEPLEVLLENADFFIINKPASIPIHPCGRYFNNSMIKIIEHEYNLTNLKFQNRLDRDVSGIQVFCKTKTVSALMQDLNVNNQVKKIYLAEVDGANFPDQIKCEAPINTDNRVSYVSETGKLSSTTFYKVKSGDKSSLVLCSLGSGRQHQIRVHLQYLGFPISDDFLYNSVELFGPERGKGAAFKPEEIEKIELMKKSTYDVHGKDDQVVYPDDCYDENCKMCLNGQYFSIKSVKIKLHCCHMEFLDKKLTCMPTWIDKDQQLDVLNALKVLE